MTTTENQFIDEVRPGIVTEERNALLIFSASWCEPCQQLHEQLEDILASNDYELPIYEFDVDNCEILTTEYDIRNMPTLVVYREGKIEDIINRAISYDDLENLIESLEG